MLQIDNLYKNYSFNKKQVEIVKGISLNIQSGETLGLVGESGAGKSTLGKLIVGLEKPSKGRIFFLGQELTRLSRKKRREFHKEVQMIFQDPYSSLNPKMCIAEILEEPFIVHNMYTPKEREAKIIELLNLVRLPPSAMRKYPHEFSGGERQRIGIARALALKPSFVVCDEPISALDLSIQAQIIDLLTDLQRRLGLTYLFIAHDLAMVRHISTRVAVMFQGEIVEIAKTEELFENPLHPYTRLLLSSQLSLREKRNILSYTHEPLQLLQKEDGCPFKLRCEESKEICKNTPLLREVEKEHFVACKLYEGR